MVTRVSEVKALVKKGIADPKAAAVQIRRMAESDDWKVREVAATALIEISKKRADEVVQQMIPWADDSDPNVRRTASEGLRYVARRNPEKLLPVLEKLKTDANLYVKKSVANVLRNASKKNPEFVLSLGKEWISLKDANTNWIVKDGLRKLKASDHGRVSEILDSIDE